MYLKKSIKQLLNNEQQKRLKELRRYFPDVVVEDIKADKTILGVKNTRRKAKGIIKVCFIVQMPEIWDKESPIYDAMVNNDSFSADIIVIPPYDHVKGIVGNAYENNYFVQKYPEAICAYQNGEWISMEERDYDYVFLQRPYDHYLPEGFRSYDVATHSLACYVPYGFSGAEVFDAGNTNKRFFRNIYFSFLESEHMAKALKKQFLFSGEKKLRKILNIGYPALAPYFYFPQRKKIKTILWTPRWSFDSALGGSNFIKYKNTFVELAKQHPDIHFVFRPHPLMFGEIIKKGIMSESDVEAYLKQLDFVGIEYDRNTPLIDSLEKADLLITDYSSIIIHFFVTGRPIIYCDSNILFNKEFDKIGECLTVVESENQLRNALNDAVAGTSSVLDPRRLIDELEYHKYAVENIINAIEDDYNERMH